MFSGKMPRKLRACHARKKCHNMPGVGVWLEEVWPREFAWASSILFNQEDFDPNRWKRKAAYWRFVSLFLCVQRSRFWFSVLYSSIHFAYLKAKKKKKKEAGYIFTYQCCYSAIQHFKHDHNILHESYYAFKQRIQTKPNYILAIKTPLGLETKAHPSIININFDTWQDGDRINSNNTQPSWLEVQNTPTVSLQRAKTPHIECSAYDTKQSDDEAPVILELWGLQGTPSLLSLLGSLWPGVVVPDRALFIG